MAASTSPEQQPQAADAQFATLVAQLGAHDVAVRDGAVADLVGAGEAAVPALVAALSARGHTTRLEAARCLRELRAPAAAPALAALLTDPSPDLCWVAAEALAALGRAGVAPVLAALEQASWDATDLRQGAHTVFKMVRDPEVERAVAPVMHAIEGPEPEVRVPIEAFKAREALRLS
jgi:HEAT repeat protein